MDKLYIVHKWMGIVHNWITDYSLKYTNEIDMFYNIITKKKFFTECEK